MALDWWSPTRSRDDVLAWLAEAREEGGEPGGQPLETVVTHLDGLSAKLLPEACWIEVVDDVTGLGFLTGGLLRDPTPEVPGRLSYAVHVQRRQDEPAHDKAMDRLWILLMEEERLGRLRVTNRTPEETKYNFEYLLFLDETEDLGQAAREAIQRQSDLLARSNWPEDNVLQ